MKSLDQIASQGIALNSINTPGDGVSNHFIISQPGSYYLTGNLNVSEPTAIRITAAGVTVDLNGFQISTTNNVPSDGITVRPTANNCTIKNGSVIGFAQGVNTTSASARSCIFRDITALNCTNFGIRGGEGAILENCSAHDCSGTAALATGNGATLINCTASGNSATNGIQTGTGCSLNNCAASSNNGTTAISAGAGSSLSNCTVSSNTGTTAISTGNGCSLINCSASSNTVTNGISVGIGSSLINCTASNNTSGASTSAGIATAAACTLMNCAAYNMDTTAAATNSTGMGFNLQDENVIQGCTCQSNRGDGIRVNHSCIVIHNTSSSNGISGDAAGIHCIGSANRIEANQVGANTRGIDIGFLGNLIIRNGASGNGTNYSIVAGNSFGAIVLAGTNASAINGNSAPATLGSTDPWANCSY